MQQQKATYVAVSYESRELTSTMAQELRTLEEARRMASAGRSIASLLHSTAHIAAKAMTAAGADGDATVDVASPSSRFGAVSTKSMRLSAMDAQFRYVHAQFRL